MDPRHNTRKTVPFEQLKFEPATLHTSVREFYQGKDEDVFGNLYLYDPLFNWCNLTWRFGAMTVTSTAYKNDDSNSSCTP